MVGDGCSDSCAIEGTCENPLNFTDLAIPDGDQLNVHGFLPRRDGTVEGSCGGSGAEMVFRYRAPGAGVLRYGIASHDESAVAYARTDCSDASSELRCGVRSVAQTILTTGAADYNIVVDSAGQSGSEYVLGVYFAPYRREGQSCDASVLRCGPGLLCAGGECVVDQPPTLANPRALRGGSDGGDLIVLGTVTDDFQAGFAVQFFDGQNELLDLGLEDPRWREDVKHLIIPFSWPVPRPTGGSYEAWGAREGFLAEHPEVASVAIGVMDQNHVSEMVSVAFEVQPEKLAGQACEKEIPLDRCSEGLWCWDSPRGSTCQHPAVIRATACAAAPLVAVGSSTVLNASGESMWEPTDACWESMDKEVYPEGLARLVLDADVATLRLHTIHGETRSTTLLSLYSGCGESAPPLGCDHYGDLAGNPAQRSDLTLHDVPAGEYLIVVDVLGGGDYGLTVSAE